MEERGSELFYSSWCPSWGSISTSLTLSPGLPLPENAGDRLRRKSAFTSIAHLAADQDAQMANDERVAFHKQGLATRRAMTRKVACPKASRMSQWSPILHLSCWP
jgi:hypothetical protein